MTVKQDVITFLQNVPACAMSTERLSFLVAKEGDESPAANARTGREVGGTSVTSKAFTLCLHSLYFRT